MNHPIIQPPCTRCQRREVALECYAADIVAADALITELQATNEALRELLSVAFERIAAATVARRTQRDQIAALVREIRALRGREMRSAA